jgi:hypothetical protein
MNYENEHLTLVLRVIGREIYMRRIVYPKRVAEGRIPQSMADEEIRVVESLREFLLEARSRGCATLGTIIARMG